MLHYKQGLQSRVFYELYHKTIKKSKTNESYLTASYEICLGVFAYGDACNLRDYLLDNNLKNKYNKIVIALTLLF